MFNAKLLTETNGIIIASTGDDINGKEWVTESDTDNLPLLLQDGKGAAQVIADLLNLHYPTEPFGFVSYLTKRGFTPEVSSVGNLYSAKQGEAYWNVVIAEDGKTAKIHQSKSFSFLGAQLYDRRVPKSELEANILLDMLGYSIC